MKKKCSFILLFIILLNVSIFASNSDNYYNANLLLSNSSSFDQEKIQQITQLTLDLSPIEKNMLINSHKQSAALPFALNFFVGFGVGSYLQGDTLGGQTALIVDLISLGMVTTGYTIALDSIYTSNYTGTEGSGWLVGGLLCYLASKIYQSVRPFTYASEYNIELSKAIMNMAVEPKITPSDDLSFSLTYKFKI